MIFKTHIENALESLKANRTRTFLTMFGVMIGIASITVIFALSSGVGSMISSQVNNEGGALSIVRPKELSVNEKNILTTLATSKNFSKSSLTEQDAESISKIKDVSGAAPLSTFSSEIKGEGNTKTSEILATTPNLDNIINIKVKEGQFIAESANSSNIVIGAQLAVNIFGTEQVVGRTVSIKGQSFLIIGVLQRQKSSINFNNVDFDNSIIMDFSNAKALTQNNLQIQQINIKVNSVNNLNEVDKKINEEILKNHKGEHDFEVLSGNKISHPSGRLLEVGTLILALVASVSLFVGGIGIMNIMLVNVSERTREIGIRKALGANNRHILFQFLTESMIISLGGGVFGFIIGYAFSFGVSILLPFKPVVGWELASLVIGLSIIVGVIFGIYPAIRASRKDPIVSLRYYN